MQAKIKYRQRIGSIDATPAEKLVTSAVIVQNGLANLVPRTQVLHLLPLILKSFRSNSWNGCWLRRGYHRRNHSLEAGHSSTNTVSASCGQAEAVGLQLGIEVSIAAMVDTGGAIDNNFSFHCKRNQRQTG